jgi:mRNA interferase MazF
VTDPKHTSVSISTDLLAQLDTLVQHLGQPKSELVEIALKAWLESQTPDLTPNSVSTTTKRSPIYQGDIFWVQGSDGKQSVSHPHLVIQDDLINHSRVRTVVVCALTSNLKRLSVPGNVLLDEGEGNLPQQSVVEVSKLSAVEKSHLGDYIGSLDPRRVQQVLDRLRFVQTSFMKR